MSSSGYPICAPSPTGHLHIGGARTAIFCWLWPATLVAAFTCALKTPIFCAPSEDYTDFQLLPVLIGLFALVQIFQEAETGIRKSTKISI